MFEDSFKLLLSDALSEADADHLLTEVGFSDCKVARRRLLEICTDEPSREALTECLPSLLVALSTAATPDGSLINFERYVQSVKDRTELFRFLSGNPRAIEILVRLFVGSQFLTEILLRNPGYLQKLTQHKRLAELKSRQQFVEEALEAAENQQSLSEKLDALRRYQHWELLRIGACDSFRLMDLKTVTVQLSLLADSMIQTCLSSIADDMKISVDGFVVLAFGKLGGEELNYSSDIDLVFLADEKATRFWTLGQKLIKALMESTSEGFFYRVDMRLRPWGSSGALVNTVSSHVDYLRKHGMLWEKQALLKARCVAGRFEVGEAFLKKIEPLIFQDTVEEYRENVRDMKSRIEAGLSKQGRNWGQVKSGAGSIRDIEFVTQFLQLAHGGTNPEVRSINTLDGLLRLADFGFLHADEYRQLSTGYILLRTIEHSLQLMHYKQIHELPESERELAYLARRLDYPDSEQFLSHYQRHCEAIRVIYEKYILGESESEIKEDDSPTGNFLDHLGLLDSSYSTIFDEERILEHARMIERLSESNLVEIQTDPAEEDCWQVTLVGYDHPGDLTMMCGLLFVYGFDIVGGNLFSSEHVDLRKRAKKKSRKYFVNIFTVRPPLEITLPEVWIRFKSDLEEVLRMVHEDQQRKAQGKMAKRIAGALREVTDVGSTLYPVEIEIDNESSDRYTVLHIRAEDTLGFLYELSNALSVAEINIIHMIISSEKNRVFDTLYVTDNSGEKITDSNRQRELRAAVVLIKHFTHLLPHSPNPEAALLHFSEFLEQLFRQPDWVEDLSSLENSEVLDALARLLGVSNFLWEDFLRLQHKNLFPIVKNVAALNERKPKNSLSQEIEAELDAATDLADRRAKLNAFKDREMFRTDMRHILGHVTEFGKFSEELTDVAEVVVEVAYQICNNKLITRYGQPELENGVPCRFSIAALGKCGGRELGYASDIELMFIYEGNGKTSGPKQITTTEFYLKLVEEFQQTIQSRSEGIFQIDLRLRPYGKAGSLAVSLDAFEKYFSAEGAAWPYERQALVKFRPIAADLEFGKLIEQLRDELIYTEEPFDVSAMRAMREKQVTQLVQAGMVNAKLSPGGLVDTEYLIQGLQISNGHREKNLRATNTLDAMSALCNAEIISNQEYARLREAYIFQRRLIDALRVVRGHAKDLTVPQSGSEEFQFLARRLGYRDQPDQLQQDLAKYSQCVLELGQLLDLPNQNR